MMKSCNDGSRFTVGAKETTKAINAGRIAQVFVAHDCDACVVASLIALCETEHISVDYSFSKEELGERAHIKVGAATLGVVKDIR